MSALEDSVADFLRSLPGDLGVAVSGGSDSLCLAILCRKLHKGKVTAVTIQSYWRDSEWEDMKKLSNWLAKWDIDHVILSHVLGKSSKHSEEVARNQRYQVLTQWCRTNGVKAILTGHNREDQAITFLMRALRGSGIEGLSSMRKTRRMGDLTLGKPLLDFPREMMQGFLRDNNQEWIDDPANHDPVFERNFLNSFLTEFKGKVEIDALKNLALTATRVQRAEKVIESEAKRLETELVDYNHGEATLLMNFHGIQDEILLRLISRILKKVVGNRTLSLRLIERCVKHLREGENFTMAGAVFLKKGNVILIRKEKRRMTKNSQI